MFLLLACAGAPDSQRPDSEDSAIDSGENGDSGETGDSGAVDSSDTADSGETADSNDSGADTGALASTGPCASYLDAVSMGTVDDSALNELSDTRRGELNELASALADEGAEEIVDADWLTLA